MRNINAKLLAAVSLAACAAGAQAADLPFRKAAPVEYVRVCDPFGAGFFYIPGTNTCLRVGGQVRGEYTIRGGAPTRVASVFAYNLAGVGYPRDLTSFRGRLFVNLDARNQTEYGDLRTYISLRVTQDSTPPGPFGGGKIAIAGLPAGAKANAGFFQGLTNPYTNVDKAFIQFAGLTAGRAQSFFDFDAQSYELLTNSVANSGQPINMLAYTFKFGGGFSATVSAEDRNDRIIGDSAADTAQNKPTATKAAFLTYAGETIPDIVGNIRLDQGWGSLQASGAYHQVSSIPVTLASGATVAPRSKDGFAALGGAKIMTPFIAPSDNFTIQVSYQQGGMDYVNALNYYNGLSNIFDHNLSISTPVNDAFILPNGTIGLSKAGGVFGAYRHYWIPNVYSSLFGAYLKIDNPHAAQLLSAGADNARIWQIGFNTVWLPLKDFQIGAEVLYSNMRLSGAFPLATTTPFPTPADSSDVRGRFSVRRTF
ncbi:MAG: porin [Methylobacteriaceae bacterium]|nr:porin [Methylobacteriaceae bacterium]MBV9244715.1 porin [Methylobacteriaceae bacterium]